MSATALADAIERRVQTAFQSMLPEQGVVTALDPGRREVTVDVAGQTRVYNYTGTTYYPNIGDLVWIGGPPDARYVMGRINNGIRVYERIETAQLDIALTRQVDADTYRVAIFSANPDGSYSAGTATEITTTPVEGYPVIGAPDRDAALIFFNGSIYAANFDNSEARDFHARGFYGEGVNVTGDVTANSVHAGTGGVASNGIVWAAGELQSSSNVRAAGLYGNGVDVGVGNINCGNLSSSGGVGGNTVWGEASLGSNGNVNALGASLGANGVLTPGAVNCGPIGCAGVTSTGDIRGWGLYGNGIAIGGGTITCGDVHAAGVYCNGVACYGNVTAESYTTGVPSSRELKRDIRPVEESHLDTIRNAPLYHWRYSPGAVDHLDPEQWRMGPMADDLPADTVTTSEHGPAPELTGMLYRAWGAIRELDEVVAAQGEQIAALTARLDALEEAR